MLGARPETSPDRPPAIVGLAAVIGVMFLTRPYRGIIHDAHIYIGRAMADLDPAGVGRDFMFSLDRQTGFSLFRPLARQLVAVAGPGLGAEIITIAGLFLWSLAVAALALRLSPGRVGWAAAIAVLALPAGYGAFDSFGYAEAWATPRAFGEASVIAGLALLLAGRPAWALLAGLAAALLHPLMALPGLAVGGVWLALGDRRWWAVAAAGAGGVLLAALAGLPLADRLLTPLDPTWMQVLRTRTLYLFPTVWPAEAWSHIVVQIATLLAAMRFVGAEVRRMIVAVIAVAAGGLLLAMAAEVFPSLLILQLQPWRALWLTALFGNAALAIAAVGLWRRGTAERVALCVLTCAWLLADAPLGGLLAWAALGAIGWLERRDLPLGRPVLVAACLMAGLLVLLWIGQRALGAAAFLNAMPAPVRGQFWPYAMAMQIQAPILVGAAAVWALHPGGRRVRQLALAAVVLCCLGAVVAFDARTPFRKAMESGAFAASFARAAPWVDGPVYWADGDALPWHVSRQGAWAAPLQGAPALFSKELATAFHARTDFLVAHRLQRAGALSPFSDRLAAHDRIEPSPQAVSSLCNRGDGPSAIVLTDRQPQAAPPGLPVAYWLPSVPVYDMWDVNHLAWRRIDAYTVISCQSVGRGPAQDGPS